MSDKFEIAKKVVINNIAEYDGGLFNNRNWTGDHLVNLYNDGELIIDAAPGWGYFEVFGLSDEEFKALQEIYYA